MTHAGPIRPDRLQEGPAGQPATTAGTPPLTPPLLGDLSRRIRAAANAGTPAGTLATLAGDPDVTVRAAVALNPAAPAQADELLIADSDERVRTLLARRMAARLAPDQQQAAPPTLRQEALLLLEALVADEAIRVRAAIADVLKSMPTAPHALILRLAQDCEVSVSEPVLRGSPLLGDTDLLDLLARPPHPAAASCIAGRSTLSAEICDAIVATADTEAIREMLANPTTAIRDTTLDNLIAQARTQVDWQAPLVARPSLSPEAARALSQFVAAQLLQALAARRDLDRSVTQELQRRLAIRLDLPNPPAETRGLMREDDVLRAARNGETERAIALLAQAAGVPQAMLQRICTTRNARGLVSVIWKAGFSMRCAAPLQVMLARVPPDAVLMPGPYQCFPLTESEMRWQLSVISHQENETDR